jgi:hypothetical protein
MVTFCEEYEQFFLPPCYSSADMDPDKKKLAL